MTIHRTNLEVEINTETSDDGNGYVAELRLFNGVVCTANGDNPGDANRNVKAKFVQALKGLFE